MQIDYNDSIKERFIPIPYDEILSGVLKHFETQEPDSFHLLAHKIHLHYYHHYYATLQELRGLYRCFNPDRDTITNHHDDAQSSNERESKLYGHIAPLLNDANYERLTKEILEETMNRTSPYGVEVSVDFDDFEQIELYFRGESIQMDEIRDPKTLYLKKKQIQEPLYRRLFLIIKPKLLEKRAQEIAQSTGKDIDKVRIKLQKNNPLLITDEANRNIYIKLFK
ncbi:MAG: hypothetical protein U9N49_07355, partial [Campylobacterota bacterium]|nr:hypothetical protein [Campylobacterota bacterium]